MKDESYKVNDTYYPHTEHIATTLATPYAMDYTSYTGHVMRGWFVPPETTEYKFHMACDDYCRLFLGNETGKGPETPD